MVVHSHIVCSTDIYQTIQLQTQISMLITFKNTFKQIFSWQINYNSNKLRDPILGEELRPMAGTQILWCEHWPYSQLVRYYTKGDSSTDRQIIRSIIVLLKIFGDNEKIKEREKRSNIFTLLGDSCVGSRQYDCRELDKRHLHLFFLFLP